MSVQKIRAYIDENWRWLTGCAALFGVLIGTLLWKLDSLVPGYGAGEVATYNSSLSFHNILDNPLNAPYLALTRLLMYIHPGSYAVTRLVSAGIGIFTLFVFAALLKHWHNDRTAIIGTLLFGLSAWFLHTARLGTPDVALFGVFAVVAGGFWVKHTKSWFALVACFIGVAWLLYIPGMIWFVLAGVIWQFKSIDRVFKRHLLAVSFAGLALIVSLVPLGLGLYKHPHLIRQLLALPEHIPGPIQIAQNLFDVPFHLLVHGNANPATWLGTAPVFDLFTLSMFAVGGYVYLRHWRLARTPIFLLIFVVTAVLMAIGGPITYSVVIPFLYLVIAAGVTYMLDMWFSVFPRNPLARGVGWGLVGLLVGMACIYHLTHYFVGWPQAAATQTVFTAQKP
ncbi:MAG TPA: hypothetical protein VIR03_01790 [Candidatus Saccharimonadales bacterium]